MFGIVVSKDGFKIEFVTLDENKEPMYYTLNDGEYVIEKDWQIANSMNKPKWDGEKWIDTEPLPPEEPTQPQPTEISLLKQEVETLKEQQQVQGMLIDDIVFEVIPSLEEQISLGMNDITKQYFYNNAKKLMLNSLTSDGMPSYLAKKIIEGRDYCTVFKTNCYKQYQLQVNEILKSNEREDLIKESC